MLIRCLLTSTLIFAPAVQAQESTELEQVLQLLKDMKSEQSDLRAEIEALKADKNAPDVSAEAVASESQVVEEEQVAATPDPIQRKSGWIASIHPVKDRDTESAMLGRIIIDGFPMNHAEALSEFDVIDPLAYRGTGEIKIEEDGEHTFSMYLIVGERAGYPICRFSMHIEGQELFNESIGQTKSGNTRSWTSAIDLSPGYYKWEVNQFCRNIQSKNYNNVTWDLRVITPNAMNAVSLGKNYIFHRTQ